MSEPIVDKLFQEYTDKVYSEVDVSEVQFRETRLAFYAGAWAAFNVIVGVSSSPEDVAVDKIDKLRSEMEEFLQREIERSPKSGG